jgi:hypothetical protein
MHFMASKRASMVCILKTLSAWELCHWGIVGWPRTMTGWVLRWPSAVRTRLGDLLLEFIVLRHQLAILQRTGTRRPCFRPSERLFWAFLSRWWANWQRGLIIVQPATVLRWRRRGFWAIWGSGSSRSWRGGRPRISGEVRALIVRMSRENFLWGAPRIHGELPKLGFVVSQATVSRTGLSAHPEVAHLPAEPSICDRCDRSRRSRSDIRRRPRMDHASWPGRQQGTGWHSLQAYRAIVDLAPVVATSLFQSRRSALHPKALRARLLRAPPLKAAPIGLGQSTTFAVSLKGITETQAV